MSSFTYQNGVLHAEQLSLSDLAGQYGTPLYVYSRAALESAYLSYTEALGEWPHMVCFA
ncbi:MAG TPA: diaminopimelate decarboxylase, partial [Oceanospirillales bacterium]|nr:diaminopimelate decarboxylase [Oceanospirillales bacterium]